MNRSHKCCACNGAGHLKPDARPCAPCDGTGEMVTCMGCGGDMPSSEAEEHGEFCGDCRKALDRDEVAA